MLFSLSPNLPTHKSCNISGMLCSLAFLLPPVRRLWLLLLLVAGLNFCVAQSAPDRVKQIRKHLGLGQQYLKQQDADAATREFAAVLALDPQNVEAQANLGVLNF